MNFLRKIPSVLYINAFDGKGDYTKHRLDQLPSTDNKLDDDAYLASDPAQQEFDDLRRSAGFFGADPGNYGF